MNDKPIIAFDIETYKIPVPEQDYWLQRPLGISIAAAVFRWTDGNINTRVWFGQEGNTWGAMPYAIPKTSDQLHPWGIGSFLNWMNLWKDDAIIVGWNSAGFDFQVLAEESRNVELASEICSKHVDIMYHFACTMGYRLGLNAAAKGMGLKGKDELAEGQHGEIAPALWQEGIEQRKRVIQYIIQDCMTTLEVYQAIVANGGTVKWMSKKGYPMTARLGDILPVNEASKLPMPDMSWGIPFDRNYSTGWMKEKES